VAAANMSVHTDLSQLEGTAELYRRRFESSVFGEHCMLPPPEVLANMKSKEEPASYPSGPNTSFHNLTPMPHRFTEEALPDVNKRHDEGKEEHPCYQTTSGEVGRLAMTGSDLPMRWYGRSGMFTSGWVAEPKTKVNSGLNTGMDRSDIHMNYDQGWAGHLGLTHYNVANLSSSKFVGKAPRGPDS